MISGAKVVVLGETVARALFGDSDPLGATVRIQRVPFTIVGRLAPKGQTMSGKDQDDTVIMPLKTARERVLGANAVNPRAVETILVKIRDGDAVDEAQGYVRSVLRDRHHLLAQDEDDVSIRTCKTSCRSSRRRRAPSPCWWPPWRRSRCAVGGIGIMNIMLVSVRSGRARSACGWRSAHVTPTSRPSFSSSP